MDILTRLLYNFYRSSIYKKTKVCLFLGFYFEMCFELINHGIDKQFTKCFITNAICPIFVSKLIFFLLKSEMALNMRINGHQKTLNETVISNLKILLSSI